MEKPQLLFRAWDKKFQVMLPGVAVYDDQNIIVTDTLINEIYGNRIDERLETVEDAGPEHYCITGDIDIMQYTGREDTRKVKIYEGDIILHGESKREVIRLDCRWIAKRVNGTECILLSFATRPLVMGNIYTSNVDLL